MKTELAGELLSAVVDLGDDLDSILPRLEAKAAWKWDSYEGFRAGQRFLESLARWLQEFEEPARRRWLEFVLETMVFVSAHELDHLIATAYETVLRPVFIRRTAERIGLPHHRIAEVTASLEFREEQRRTLIVGLSDGARLDQLRRSNVDLSHEQYAATVHSASDRAAELVEKLDNALAIMESTAERAFSHVVLVDDFYGSGTSLINWSVEDADGNRRLKGKIEKFRCAIAQVANAGNHPPLLEKNYDATILLYIASEEAADHIRKTLAEAKLPWDLRVMQLIPRSSKITDPELLADCRKFWDSDLEDEHKSYAALGYRDCALPLVLHHNAPNNSVCPLWADSTGRGDKNRHALFPRYERHHKDRP
ncbi:hypothetical protein [Antrihabitans spumae]|uniref:PRTase-CE domain-containing protein n=1 Tax=Antrihabitans spumae TaxID=3373370 RepID=A0ABW7KN25_9NOCA